MSRLSDAELTAILERCVVDDDTLGRAAHEAWKKWRVEKNYPDHAWVTSPEKVCAICIEQKNIRWSSLFNFHHDDMIPWEDLNAVKREKYIVQGVAASELARTDVPALVADLQDARREAGHSSSGAPANRVAGRALRRHVGGCGYVR